MDFLIQHRAPRHVQCPNCSTDVPEKQLHEHKKACPFEIEHCKYYGCTATFVRKDVKSHERLELLNHSKLMLRLPDDLNDLATRTNSERNGEHDAADMTVLSRVISTLKGHLALLLLLVILILGTYCINGWGKHFYESFYGTKKGIEGERHSDRELDVAPVIIKMPDFKQKRREDKEWVSRSFYAFHEGFLVFLKVYAAGTGDYKDESLSVFLVLMKGPYDDRLQELDYWPMCGKFDVKLLNQFDSRDHYTEELMSNYDCVDRVTENYVSNTAWGRPDFISHLQLLYGEAKFLVNDTLYFEVTYKDTPMLDLFLISIMIVVLCCICICCTRQ